MTTEKVSTLGGFLNEVRKLREEVWRLDDKTELWFRGESRDHEKTLLRPELYRPRKSGFALRPIADLLDIESDLCNEFQRCSEQFRSETPDRKYWEWDLYFLLQHHGGATRLLDWSDGALMALHFAVRDPKDDEHAADALVYVLDPDRLDGRLQGLHAETGIEKRWREHIKQKGSARDGPDEDEWEYAYLPRDAEERADFPIPCIPFVLHFPHITRRVAAQRSRFVVFGTECEFLAEEFKRDDTAIRRIEVDGKCRPAIRRELRDSGVTESVIYPDLDGLGREMKQLWQQRK